LLFGITSALHHQNHPSGISIFFTNFDSVQHLFVPQYQPILLDTLKGDSRPLPAVCTALACLNAESTAISLHNPIVDPSQCTTRPLGYASLDSLFTISIKGFFPVEIFQKH
jgi:hypothetical protein